MDTLKCIISKANSIRFAHVDGLMRSFDNRLSYEETWNRFSTPVFCHEWYKDDIVLLQVKAGLTATVVVTKITEDGTESAVTLTGTTSYSGFKIYDYVMTFSSVERFYFTVVCEESSWKSEWNNVEEEDTESESPLRLLEWSNLDLINNAFEFDYDTTAAKANVNFMRLPAEDLNYIPAGESENFNNQNEIVKIKSDLFRKIEIKTGLIPRQVAELIVIAMQHDLFLLNDVGYVLEELPAVKMLGAMAEVTAEMTLQDSLGFNTHDIGFNCDSTDEIMVINLENQSASGSLTFGVTEGFGVTQIIAKKISGTPILKVGSTPAGDEVMMADTISGTVPPDIINTRYAPNSSGAAWTLYYNVTGGVIDILVQTIRFTPVT